MILFVLYSQPFYPSPNVKLNVICSENKDYLNSWLHTELPFNNCMAQFGSLPGPAVYTHGESAESATWRGKGVQNLQLGGGKESVV